MSSILKSTGRMWWKNATSFVASPAMLHREIISRSVKRRYTSSKHNGPNTFDAASSARNIAGWMPDPGEVPPELPEVRWRSLALGQDLGLVCKNEEIAFQKRLHWSCKNRGWAEMGELLDSFYRHHIHDLSFAEQKQLSRILMGT